MNQANQMSYAKAYSSFDWERPEYYNFAVDVIDNWAQQDPGKQAIFWVDDEGQEKSRTFQEISANSKKLCKSRSPVVVRIDSG